jgi:hypothetical protein
VKIDRIRYVVWLLTAYPVRVVAAEIAYAATTFGYWIRPYDMLADRRRWRWQPQQRCGFTEVPQDVMDELLGAARRRLDSEEGRS